MSEKDCLQYCYENGWSWQENGYELYVLLDRVSCWCCGNKNQKELRNIYEKLPGYWDKLNGTKIHARFRIKARALSILKRNLEKKKRISR